MLFTSFSLHYFIEFMEGETGASHRTFCAGCHFFFVHTKVILINDKKKDKHRVLYLLKGAPLNIVYNMKDARGKMYSSEVVHLF